MNIGEIFLKEVISLKYASSFKQQGVIAKLADAEFIEENGLDVRNPKESFIANSHFVLIFFVMACQVIEIAKSHNNKDQEDFVVNQTINYYNWVLEEINYVKEQLSDDHHAKLMDLYNLSYDYALDLIFPQEILDIILVHKLAGE